MSEEWERSFVYAKTVTCCRECPSCRTPIADYPCCQESREKHPELNIEILTRIENREGIPDWCPRWKKDQEPEEKQCGGDCITTEEGAERNQVEIKCPEYDRCEQRKREPQEPESKGRGIEYLSVRVGEGQDEEMRKDNIVIEIINGVEGDCLAIDNIRVAGPKPWGGGRVVKKFMVKKARLLNALNITESTDPAKKEPEKVQAELGQLRDITKIEVESLDIISKKVEQAKLLNKTCETCKTGWDDCPVKYDCRKDVDWEPIL